MVSLDSSTHNQRQKNEKAGEDPHDRIICCHPG